ncbi:MAG: TonB-dependent receptor domain-containing protein [Chitinophagales bacterium]
MSGTVSDSESNDPLIGVNVVIKGTTIGTITDIDGNFTLTNNKALPWEVEVSYVGYEAQTMNVTSPNDKLTVKLMEGLLLGEGVVVSASRKREKIQEAPASISVITARKLEASAQAADPVRNLISTPGVQIQQQSAARINIEMRGSASLFNTGVFPIMDYRSLSGPGIGTFVSDGSGISSLDLQRIEVVRGPGSALYGPGVTSGVVHFITKTPIQHPGTSVEIMGGELSTFGTTVRHAGRNEKGTFGYKINAQYKRGDEFTLDLVEDADQIAKFQTSIIKPGITNGVVDVTAPATTLLTQEDLDPDGDGNMMQDFWENAAANVTLEFRPQDDLSVFVSGGYNTTSSVFYNSQGEGLTQFDEIWTQARVQKGGLFAQAFFVSNNGGGEDNPTFLYQTGNSTSVGRKQIEGQVQYNFSIPSLLNADITTGVDYRSALSDTKNTVYGRNENDDDFTIIGGYLQSKFKLSDKLDLIGAARYDQFNFLDDGEISPRLALVYKPDARHTIRASYNRSSAPPTALNINIDFPVSTPAPGIFDIWLVGSKNGQQFADNPMIDMSIPGVPDLPYGTPGLPLAIPYGAVTGGVLQALATQLDPGTVELLTSLLTNPANTPAGVSGDFVSYNAFNGQPLTPIDAPTAVINITDTYEIGYKGFIANKLGVSLDIYNNKSKGFSQFTAISPTIRLANQNIAADLGAEVQAIIQPQIEAALIAGGVDAATAAAQAAGLGAALNGGYNAAIDGEGGFVEQVGGLFPIIGAVETLNVPQDGLVHSAAGYRYFGEIDYLGADLGLTYNFSQDLSAFLNYSWLSENVFEGEDLGEAADSPLRYTLNAPKSKYRLGLNYTPESGIRGSMSFQHDDSFFVDYGQFSGDTQVKNLIDASVGYKFTNGLSVDATASNLFNNEYRAFPNLPKIGRRILLKATYNFK